MSRYVPKNPSTHAVMVMVEKMQTFEDALTQHYGARIVPNASGHKQFTNPWAMKADTVGYIFIRKRDMQVRFGSSITQSQIMSEAMFLKITSKSYPMPRVATPERVNPSPVGRL